jgi:hypothetical protein
MFHIIEGREAAKYVRKHGYMKGITNQTSFNGWMGVGNEV